MVPDTKSWRSRVVATVRVLMVVSVFVLAFTNFRVDVDVYILNSISKNFLSKIS